MFSSSGQQCCYDANGDILHPTHPGAGTPDKEAQTWDNLLNHYKSDVIPYMNCCLRCEYSNMFCPLYVAKARSGDTTHCMTNNDENAGANDDVTTKELVDMITQNLTTTEEYTDVGNFTKMTTEGTTP